MKQKDLSLKKKLILSAALAGMVAGVSLTPALASADDDMKKGEMSADKKSCKGHKDGKKSCKGHKKGEMSADKKSCKGHKDGEKKDCKGKKDGKKGCGGSNGCGTI